MSASAMAGKSNRLAKLINQPGGLTTQEAVQAADANLKATRGLLVVEVTATVERMQALWATLKVNSDQHGLEKLYALANSGIGIAGPAGLEALGQVCNSLCELIDHLQTTQTWNMLAIQVHMDSLQSLRFATAEGKAQQETIVAALKQVVGQLSHPLIPAMQTSR